MERQTTCSICNKVVSAEKLKKHINNSHPTHFSSEVEKTKFIMFSVEGVDEEKLNEILEVYKTDISTSELERRYGFKFRKYIDGLGLEAKTIKDSMNYDSVKQLQVQNTKTVYGVENPSQADYVKKRKARHYLTPDLVAVNNYIRRKSLM